jgi:tRNA modification GTPase
VFSPADTIVAIATPPGRGGLGVVRLSGPAARQIARDLIGHPYDLDPRHATLTVVRRRSQPPSDRGEDARRRPLRSVSQMDATAASGQAPPPARYSRRSPDAIDQVVATYFPAPASYTGDDVVELSAHGSPVVLHGIVESAIGAGARLAEPGEFTLRAFLNGRINLVQAEAVRDLIDAVTPLQARAAFDQLQGTLTASIGELDTALFELMAGLEASVD